AVPGVPDPHRVDRDGGGERAAVRAPGQPQDRVRGALEAEGGLAGVGVVKREARVRPGPGEMAAVGAEGEVMDAAGQGRVRAPRRDPRRPPQLPGGAVPDPDVAVPLEAGEGLTVGAELHVGEAYLPIVGLEREPILVAELPEIAPLPAAAVG